MPLTCLGEAGSGDDDEIDLTPLTKSNRFTHRSIIASNRSMIIALNAGAIIPH
jgi:hypothetical protein